MPVEAIIILYFILVLAPVAIVLAYCGIRGIRKRADENKKGS